jgi:hypothetical protein
MKNPMTDKVLKQLIETNPEAALAYIKDLRSLTKPKPLNKQLEKLLEVIPGNHAGLELMTAIAKYLGAN